MKLGKYDIVMQIGQGGMATLFLARIRGPEGFQKLVALKQIHRQLVADEKFVRMFLDEARIAALIDHPNVATIFDLGEAKGCHYMAMEYIHGQSLMDILKAATRLPGHLKWSHAAWIIAEAARGLHAAHELHNADGKPLQVVHRDISPHNVLVSYDGHVKLVDFGIAYAAERLEQTSTGSLKGKAAYMSPEQTAGKKLTRASDIFSLGIVLFEATCMKRLFRESTEAATLLKAQKAVVPKPRSINPDLPVELEQIILKALARDKDKRFATAMEMSKQLSQILLSKGEVVGPDTVASLMDFFFHDRKKIKEREIHLALKKRGRPTDQAIAMVGNSSTALTVEQIPSKNKTRRWRPTTWIVLGVTLVTFVTLVTLVSLLRGRCDLGEPSTKEHQRVDDSNRKAGVKGSGTVRVAAPSGSKPRNGPVPKRTGGSTVEIKISVLPAAAEPVVTFRGEEYQGSVFAASVTRTNKPEKLVIRAARYRTMTLVLLPTHDQSLTFTLKPTKRRRSSGSRDRPPQITDIPPD